ncbi:hypothetical protein B4N89_45655 [Embleya scabrispora]|uniref:DUF397 domain-containing protein n=1 Tax=Embleya scabrispora TaxID=159449 RepID=A0A1T3NIU9_9ACTN|nr:DUF397 domain-containing protein [Embleya scabrispora]OPC76767.1 hypothetical protein B4N89_45655 [Embleya scabrispora]
MTSPGHKAEPAAPQLDQARWHTSSFSNGGEQCVQVAHLPGGHTAIRDSKAPTHGHLRYTARTWTAFCNTTHQDPPGSQPSA